MKYQIIDNSNPQWLADAVNRWLAEGWKPLGGVSMTITEYNNTKYAQAIVKDDK